MIFRIGQIISMQAAHQNERWSSDRQMTKQEMPHQELDEATGFVYRQLGRYEQADNTL